MEGYASKPLPRRGFAEEQNPGDSHDRCSAGENRWHGGERSAPLEKKKKRNRSRASRADAVESIVCGYLSIVLIVGLAATRILGWWWLDGIAALALIPFIMKGAREAVRGEECCGS